MKLLLQLIFALIGAAVAVFYLGNLASDALLATRSFESSEDVMFQHNLVYLATIVIGFFVGWFVGGVLGRLFGWGA